MGALTCSSERVSVDQRGLGVLRGQVHELLLLRPPASLLEKAAQPLEGLALARPGHTMQEGTRRLAKKGLVLCVPARFPQAAIDHNLQKGLLLCAGPRQSWGRASCAAIAQLPLNSACFTCTPPPAEGALSRRLRSGSCKLAKKSATTRPLAASWACCLCNPACRFASRTLPELRPLRLFKNSRAKLLNWCLQGDYRTRSRVSKHADMSLDTSRRCYLEQLPSLPAGVACVRPVQQHWKVAATGSATVLRRGFPVPCDYAGAARSFMGSTLPACALHLGAACPCETRSAVPTGACLG